MFRYSQRSESRLGTCNPRLQTLFRFVLCHWDHTVIEGHRGEERQNELKRTGRSKLIYPDSRHNATPLSLAVDVVPCDDQGRIDWQNRDRFILFAGFVLGCAANLGIAIRWGGDWDGDHEISGWEDLAHWELIT